MVSRTDLQWLLRFGTIPICGLILVILNYYALEQLSSQTSCQPQVNCNSISQPVPKAPAVSESTGSNYTTWLRVQKLTTVHLRHVENVFKVHDNIIIKGNHSNTFDENNWDTLWSHAYPFTAMKAYFKKLVLPHCINHFPGIGFITNKVVLATSDFAFIPKAFQIPKELEKLKKYEQLHPNTMFVQKSSDHRGIRIKKMADLNLTSEGTFIQEFIHKPLLINGHKFDIGVYVILTSVDPLRVYMYEGDVLFRFCPDKYHPFSADEPDKYVVGDDYLPTWKVPDLKDFYVEQGLSMKASFDEWMKARKQDPEPVWAKVRESIRQVVYAKEAQIIKGVANFPSQLRFFEMMRFDFIISDDLQVFLMEANMSPNLSSAHFKQNTLLYEQVVYNVLSLVGVRDQQCSRFSHPANQNDMRVALKDIVVFPEHCSVNCRHQCDDVSCQLCAPCLQLDDIRHLKTAYSEHTSRAQCRRLIPAPNAQREDLSAANTLMAEWFRGKCMLDITFCS